MPKKKVSYEELLGFEIKKEQLHPPIAPPKPMEGEKSEINDGEKLRMDTSTQKSDIITDSKLAIDYNSMPMEYWKWCNSLDTKRSWELAATGKTHRGSTQQLKRDVQKKRMELDMVELMRKERAPLYKEVMKELKERFKKNENK